MSSEVSASGLRAYEDYLKNQSSSKGGNNLEMDDFLKLFVAQLSCQDPLSGSSGSGSGTDYISQLAQMTVLEQLSGMNDAFTTNQAYSLIGKYVFIGDGSSSDLILGKVDGVVNEDGVNYLMVNGNTYELSDVYSVADSDWVSTVTDDELLAGANLIGKTVTAIVADEDGETSTVTGKVEKLLVKDGELYLVVDGKNIALGQITEISASGESSGDTSGPESETEE